MERKITLNRWLKKNESGLVIHYCENCGKPALQQRTIYNTVEEILTSYCPFCGLKMKMDDE